MSLGIVSSISQKARALARALQLEWLLCPELEGLLCVEKESELLSAPPEGLLCVGVLLRASATRFCLPGI